MDELARRLASGPGTFPHSIDALKDLILFIALDETEIQRASFLDQRILTPHTWGRWLPFQEVADRFDPYARDDAHYIFHIGHVGSTLISRLLGEIAGTLALREPLLLRELSKILADDAELNWTSEDFPIRTGRIVLLRRLLARTFRTDQRVIIKATSFVSEIAHDLMAPEARAAFIFTSLPSYMTTILAGENSRRELDTLMSARVNRLAHRLGEAPYWTDPRDEGERVALAWVTEMLALQDAATALPDNTAKWVDFDKFLENPGEGLLALASHFEFSLAPHEASRIINGPMMRQYSKAPEYGYSAELRLQLQTQAARDHRDVIRRGTAWIKNAIRRHPRLEPLAAHID